MAEKAIIQVLDGKQKNKNFKVLFNPNSYSIDHGNQYTWHTIPGLSLPLAQFVSGQTPTLSMELFFDCSDKGPKADIRLKTSEFANLLSVDSELHVPPTCKFVWGSLQFKGVIEKISQKFTMFSAAGNPIRATMNVTFKAVASVEEQLQGTPRHSPDRTKQKTLKQGDQLWLLAAEEYEDPKHWRAIADANNIDNPRILTTGRRVVVPRLE
ncbi:CIS tube protein [Tumebacillus permanentifrigoris]|uniref:LysM domain-containing protein n=1 Tax=Tumebacillus permanentifrigoris TaxID=378543 RepID=A0A316D7I1_9BACL|nr:LysM peptidoglycan-binding domain-containing protein [Tumebacillus permanentifrigoris]PWK11528.1 LysM domain-containing protein [Tumebacillus permanentifrigoris]